MNLYELTKSQVKDDSGKLSDPFDYDAAVSSAIKRYSKHRPRLVVVDLVGANSNDLDLPADWSPGFSAFETVEYPVGRVPATLLDSDLWQLYHAPSGSKLRILHASISASETVRGEYSILHDESSIPGLDLEAVANLAASFCLRQLAAAYGNTSDPVIQADAVNYRSKGDEYARRAKELEALYKNHIGIRDGDTVPAAVASASLPGGNRIRMTHLRSR